MKDTKAITIAIETDTDDQSSEVVLISTGKRVETGIRAGSPEACLKILADRLAGAEK